MSFKRIICLICLGAFEFGCSNQNYVKLPECKQVISLDSTLNLSVSSFLKNSRPKIVTLSNMHCFRMIDIPLLRKQIEENPEFDFIFYVECENLSLLDELKHFVCDNKLQTVLFIDKIKNIGKRTIYTVESVIFPELSVRISKFTRQPWSAAYIRNSTLSFQKLGKV